MISGFKTLLSKIAQKHNRSIMRGVCVTCAIYLFAYAYLLFISVCLLKPYELIYDDTYMILLVSNDLHFSLFLIQNNHIVFYKFFPILVHLHYMEMRSKDILQKLIFCVTQNKVNHTGPEIDQSTRGEKLL